MDTRIGLIFNRYRSDGGTERITSSVFDALAEDNVEWIVLTRRWGGALPPNVRVIECRPFAVGRRWRLQAFVRALEQQLDRLSVDFVQSQVHLPRVDIFRADGGVHAEWLEQRRRAAPPLKRWWRRMGGYHRDKLRMEQQMYASDQLRAVICNSYMVRDDIRRRFPTCRAKLWVIENGIDVARFKRDEAAVEAGRRTRAELGIADDAPVFICVGSGFERKGVNTAIAALAKTHPAAHLLVVGRDSRMGNYRRMARAHGVDARVHFTGARDDVRPYFWAADALVHPALYEAFGIVIAEAMAAGLPVIASERTGAARAMVAGPETGCLLDALDIEGFACAMHTYAERSALECERGRISCEAIAQDYSIARMRRELLEFYDGFS
ncbi:glycosyltransferase family 4 protein [uncultured Salinisphaera sp.]|uniref:glycosyltransferase family 4 protein n=1 Tax=uncultured Salinisphaera sp. TaxID=359372 RepID=UPI0032B264F7